MYTTTDMPLPRLRPAGLRRLAKRIAPAQTGDAGLDVFLTTAAATFTGFFGGWAERSEKDVKPSSIGRASAQGSGYRRDVVVPVAINAAATTLDTDGKRT